MPSKERVAAKLAELIERLDGAEDHVHADLARALSDPRVIQVDVSDLAVSFWTEMDGGRMGPLHEGPAAHPHIRITASSHDLIAMIDGEKGLFSSFLAGHVRMDASLFDLIALRKLI